MLHTRSVLVGAGVLLIGGTELVHWRASRRHVGRPAHRDGVAPGVVLAIAIASTPLHAARARRYLARQRPDLAGRLTSADDYRFGERWPLKVTTVGYALGAAVVRRVVPSRRTAMS